MKIRLKIFGLMLIILLGFSLLSFASDVEENLEFEATNPELIQANVTKSEPILYDSILNLDYPVRNESVDKTLRIGGWALSEDEQAFVRVLMDGKVIICDRTYRPDVLSAVSGYGGADTNPTPGFVTNIDVSNLSNGVHMLNVQLVTRDNIIVAGEIRNFVIEKYKVQMIVDTPTNNKTIEGTTLFIGGWVMSNQSNITVRVLMDGKVIICNRTYRPDVLSAVSGYGGANTNPTPGFVTNIDISKFKSGMHSINVQAVTEDNIVIAGIIRNVKINDYDIKMILDVPVQNESIKSTLTISGWLMCNKPSITVRALIDGKVIICNRTYRPDVLSAVSGYGGANTNPTPGFVTSIDTSGINDGNYAVNVQAVDLNGEIIAGIITNIHIKKYNSILNLDAPTENSRVSSKFAIQGWMLSDNSDAYVRFLIDNKLIETTVYRSYRADVLSAFSGYGGRLANPTPGFYTTMDVTEFKDGVHTLTVQMLSNTGEYMSTINRKITIKKYSGITNIDTPQDNTLAKSKIQINGWEMSDVTNTTVRVLVNDKVFNVSNYYRTTRPDVIKAIAGYGGIQTNPTPGFHMEIDSSSFKEGPYTIKVQTLSEDGELISSNSVYIYVSNKLYNGIDVSKWQGRINWSAVKADGIDFAMIRILGATNITDLGEDAYFRYNITNAQANGIKTGIYHYGYAVTPDEARIEANKVLQVLGNTKLTYPIAYDVENEGTQGTLSKSDLADVILAFKQVIENSGNKFILYANLNWLKNKIDMTKLSNADVWVAQWRNVTLGPQYGTNVAMWQYTSTGTVNGIDGCVDRNIGYKQY